MINLHQSPCIYAVNSSFIFKLFYHKEKNSQKTYKNKELD